MQRIAPNAMPPRKSGTNQPCGGKGEEESPAYRMARRIQREQGPQRATQYLMPWSPFWPRQSGPILRNGWACGYLPPATPRLHPPMAGGRGKLPGKRDARA